MRKTAEQKVHDIIFSLSNKQAGFIWRSLCKSDSSFLKSWPLGRAGRRLCVLASRRRKTAGLGAAKGFVVVRHAELAIKKIIEKIKSRGAMAVHEFIEFIVRLGLWAARIAAMSLKQFDVSLRRQRKLNLMQELQIQI